MAFPRRVRIYPVYIISLTNPVRRGLITLSIGIATFFRMPPSPTQTKTWFRPKGWFNEREETIAVSRILRDDPTKVRALKSATSFLS
jgi:hypothetical protein